jgi:RNA-binding protein 26
MNGNVPFLPMFGGMPFGIAQGAPYDPHEARMDMHPNGIGMGRGMHQRAPLLPRVPQDDGSQAVLPVDRSGELPVIQDLTPQPPPESVPPTAPAADRIQQSSAPVQQHPIQPMDVDMGVSSMPGPSTYNTRGGRGGGMRGAPRGRGVFAGDAQAFRPERRQDKTLVVEKIPEDKLNLDAVNSWFKRFGTVTNVAIDVRSAKALVSFSEHNEAHAAWKSEDAVFGNRFVKVFWHRPMEGHGQQGSRMLAASASLLVNLGARGSPTPSALPQSPAPHATTPARKPPVQSAAASELATKQKLLEQQIAEQKSLMASLETTSGEEKKEILARLRKLGEEMKVLSVPPSSAIPSKIHSPAPAGTAQNDHERKERERLDKELEMHAVGESTEELKAKLAKLREEAASLGIPPTTTDTSYGAPYRGYRGRGRGSRGAFYRGAPRGGPPRASMKLDNRPRKLLVKGVREDAVQALRDWYEVRVEILSSFQVSGL